MVDWIVREIRLLKVAFCSGLEYTSRGACVVVVVSCVRVSLVWIEGMEDSHIDPCLLLIAARASLVHVYDLLLCSCAASWSGGTITNFMPMPF